MHVWFRKMPFYDGLLNVLMLLGVVFWVIVCAAGGCALYICARIPTERQLKRVVIGMTRAEVKSIIGNPYKEGTGEWYYWSWGAPDPIGIGFDEDGRVNHIR